MNNQELEIRIKEILAVENFFDMIEAANDFEKEYKKTDFFKKTKMSLIDVIKNGKVWYALQLDDVGSKIQKIINELNYEKVNEILDQFGNIFQQENMETLNIFKEFKEIVK